MIKNYNFNFDKILNIITRREDEFETAQVALILSKFLSVIFSVITIPMILTEFGKNEFGIYVSVMSFLTLFSLLDLGYSSILHSTVPKLNTYQEKMNFYSVVLRRQISILLFSFSFLFLISILLFANQKHTSEITIHIFSVAIPAIIGYFLYLVGNIVFRMLIALEKLIVASVLLFFGNFLTFLYLVFACFFIERVEFLSFGTFGIQGICNIIFYFIFHKRQITEPQMLVDWKTKRKNQFQLLIIQATYIVGFQLDVILVANFLGLQFVPEYAIYQKIYSVPIAIISIFFLPLWTKSASGAKKRKRQSLLSALLSFFALTALMSAAVYFSVPFLSAKLFSFDVGLFVAFQIYLILFVITSPIISFVNGQEKWSWIMKSTLSGLTINLVLTVLGLQFLQWSGIAVIASASALFLSVWLPFNFSTMSGMKTEKNFWKKIHEFVILHE